MKNNNQRRNEFGDQEILIFFFQSPGLHIQLSYTDRDQ